MDTSITIVCREVDKNTGRIATYVCKKNVGNNDLQIVRIRSTFNPELTYYAIRTCTAEDPEALEDLLVFLKRRRLTDAAIEQYGGIVKL